MRSLLLLALLAFGSGCSGADTTATTLYATSSVDGQPAQGVCDALGSSTGSGAITKVGESVWLIVSVDTIDSRLVQLVAGETPEATDREVLFQKVYNDGFVTARATDAVPPVHHDGHKYEVRVVGLSSDGTCVRAGS